MSFRWIAGATLVGAPLSAYAVYATSTLDQRYPRVPVSSSSPLASPSSQTRVLQSSGPELFGATIATSLLPADKAAWTPYFARAFLSTPQIQIESRIAGPWSLEPPYTTPGNVGEDGTFEKGQRIANLWVVEDAPSRKEPLAPLVLSWTFPEGLVKACELAAKIGYPFRFMSGGRQVLEVREVEGKGHEVVVAFGGVHEYETERSGNDGKEIPVWVQDLHQAYSRLLLDEAVRKLRREAASGKGVAA